MDKITYSQPSNPESWSTDNIHELPFKFATHDDAQLAAAHLNPIMAELDRLRALNAELAEKLETWKARNETQTAQLRITKALQDALQLMLAEYGNYHMPPKECVKLARAALAKVGAK